MATEAQTLQATNNEQRTTSNAQRICPLHLSRVLYKSTPFYAKQTQFPKGQNERKFFYNKGLSKPTTPSDAPKTNPIKPNFQNAKMNVSSFKTKDYENQGRLQTPGKQTQSNPIFFKFQTFKIPNTILTFALNPDFTTWGQKIQPFAKSFGLQNCTGRSAVKF